MADAGDPCCLSNIQGPQPLHHQGQFYLGLDWSFPFPQDLYSTLISSKELCSPQSSQGVLPCGSEGGDGGDPQDCKDQPSLSPCSTLLGLGQPPLLLQNSWLDSNWGFSETAMPSTFLLADNIDFTLLTVTYRARADWCFNNWVKTLVSENINNHLKIKLWNKKDFFTFKLFSLWFNQTVIYITSYFLGKVEHKTCRESGVLRSDGIPIGIWQTASPCVRLAWVES